MSVYYGTQWLLAEATLSGLFSDLGNLYKIGIFILDIFIFMLMLIFPECRHLSLLFHSRLKFDFIVPVGHKILFYRILAFLSLLKSSYLWHLKLSKVFKIVHKLIDLTVFIYSVTRRPSNFPQDTKRYVGFTL